MKSSSAKKLAARRQTPSQPAQSAAAVKSPSHSPRAFSVPESVRALDPFELPLSTRLEAALRRHGVLHLGDLHARPQSDLRAVGNCGAGTLAELVHLIKRAAGGEFSAPAAAARKPADLVHLLDALVAKLPARNRAILRLRLGAESGDKHTLAETGQAYGLTRERVRQVIEICVERIRRSGSLRLKFHLSQLEARCRKAGQPLSSGLLGQWLGASSASLRSSLDYYVRLLVLLHPGLDGD
jgi:hypothetical protein